MSINPLPLKQRSAATNGRRPFVEKVDRRSAWMRRWRDLCLTHANDLGGVDNLSEGQSSLIRRIATLEVELESCEASLSEGKNVDRDAFGRLIGRLCRCYEILGIQRLAKPIDPYHDLAKGLEAYPRIDDDDGDGRDDESLPIEEAVEPTNGGSKPGSNGPPYLFLKRQDKRQY